MLLVFCLLFHLPYPFIHESNVYQFTQPATELNCILPLHSLSSSASNSFPPCLNCALGFTKIHHMGPEILIEDEVGWVGGGLCFIEKQALPITMINTFY